MTIVLGLWMYSGLFCEVTQGHVLLVKSKTTRSRNETLVILGRPGKGQQEPSRIVLYLTLERGSYKDVIINLAGVAELWHS